MMENLNLVPPDSPKELIDNSPEVSSPPSSSSISRLPSPQREIVDLLPELSPLSSANYKSPNSPKELPLKLLELSSAHSRPQSPEMELDDKLPELSSPNSRLSSPAEELDKLPELFTNSKPPTSPEELVDKSLELSSSTYSDTQCSTEDLVDKLPDFSSSINSQLPSPLNDLVNKLPELSSPTNSRLQSPKELVDELPEHPSSPSSSINSSPPRSPNEFCDSAHEIESRAPSSRKKCSLPYFYLPNPDLDQFFSETSKKFHLPDPESQSNVPSLSDKTSENTDIHMLNADSPDVNSVREETRKVSLKPPDSSSKVIYLDIDYGKSYVTKSNTPNGMSRKISLNPPVSSSEVIDLEIDYSKNCATERNIHNGIFSSAAFSNEYSKLVSSITQLDDTKSPGIKRLALKEFLKNKIGEKKALSFNISKAREKEMSMLENEDMEFEEEKDFEENDSEGDGHSDEESLFGEHINRENCPDNEDKALNENSESEQLDDDSPVNGKSDSEQLDNESSCESDEDILPLKKRKSKIVPIIEDESSDNEDSLPGLNSLDKGCESTEGGDLTIPPKDTGLPLYESDSEISEVLRTSCPRNFDMTTEPDFENSSSLPQSTNGEGCFPTGLSEISASLPSYQPGGGFLNQESNHSSDSAESEIQSTNFFKENLNDAEDSESLDRSSHLLKLSTGEEMSDNPFRPTCGFPLDDLPVSQAGKNVDDMFETEDLADICSGAFKSSACGETAFEENSIKHSLLKDTADDDNLSDLNERPHEKVKDFFDYEAELSGEDDGEEDDDLENDNEMDDDICVPDPLEEEFPDEITDLYRKQMYNDDEALLNEIKEQFLDDGELNSDGPGRIRKFAWKNNDVDNIGNESDSSSASDSEQTESLTINQEKVKWRQESKEEDLGEELNSSYKRRSFKVNIIGKLKFSCNDEKPSKQLSVKRPRGSFLHMDESSACQVLKKLKTGEDESSGSRTTKHFVFRNDLDEGAQVPKKVSVKPVVKDLPGTSNLLEGHHSIFNKI